MLDSVRATSAAPWYLDEMAVAKDLTTGEVLPAGRRPGEGSVAAALRLIDGGICCNNPTGVAVHEARLLFGRERPLLLVSVGTGAGVATETAPSAFFPAWLQNLVNATGDVAQTDATVRHLLGPADSYFRLCPTGEAFAVALDDARDASLQQLSDGADAYMATPAARALVARLVVGLLPRQQPAAAAAD